MLLGLGFMAVLAVMIPLGPGGELVAPDLLYCLLVAWVVRRPARTPLWAVVALGLFADVMLSRPIGLGALALMLAVEAFRRRALLFHGAPFLLEWAAAVAGFALMLAGMHLALGLVVRRAARARAVAAATCWRPRSPTRWWCSGSPGACGCARRGAVARPTGWGGCHEGRSRPRRRGSPAAG